MAPQRTVLHDELTPVRRTLCIELKRTSDGRPSLACVREDGTRTWARVHPFLPTHDLTHCAVESVLGVDDAFFGLIAQGWDIDDFAAAGVVKRLPAAALCVEQVVGHIERAIAVDAEALAEALALEAARTGRAPCHAVREDQLAAIGRLRGALLEAWRATPTGETLRITFPVAPPPP
ncbi:MAG: hypothetical protein ACKOCV_07535 [Gemmatimonadota bacterium]